MTLRAWSWPPSGSTLDMKPHRLQVALQTRTPQKSHFVLAS
jgi:hypothetical protein